MKQIIFTLAVASILAVSGCDKSTSGGPGADLPPSEQATMGQTDDTFSLDMPMMSTTIVQGATATVTIGIRRGTNIDQDVTVRFSDLPAGVSVMPVSPVIMRGDEEATVTLGATADAALGDFVVKVVGEPSSGPSTKAELKINVETP